MICLGVLSVVLGYLLGSIPSAYLIGRFWAKIDLRQEGVGHVSATAVYRNVGRIAFLVVLIMDAAKGVLAIYIATLLTSSSAIIIATAYAAVVGHCWSVFIGFRGGLGAMVTYAVLGALAFWEFLIGVAAAIVLLLATRKSSLSTYGLLIATSLMLLIEERGLIILPIHPGFIAERGLIIVLFPLGLILIQLLKRFHSRKVSPVSEYKNELFDDLKRIR